MRPPDGKQLRPGRLGGLCFLWLLFVLLIPVTARATADATAPPAAHPTGTIDQLLTNGGLLLTRDNAVILDRNPDRLLVPASTWKLGTALAALTILGPAHRFETLFYQDTEHTLYIRGLGDPFLVSEEVATIMAALAQAGVTEINDIVLDDSSFALTGQADGAGTSRNPYDAANSALAVNFNTVNLLVAPDRTISSAEPQTPLLPMMTRLGRGLIPGEHRINIGDHRSQVLVHAGELFRAMQQRQGIAGHGGIRPGPVPAGLPPVYRHQSSKSLPELIAAMLRYSNNFIANQLLLACGVRQSGLPATWAKGRAALTHFLGHDLGLSPETFRVEEGSGLSRRNRITPRALLAILTALKPYRDLLPQEKGGWIKSGTLTGVYAYAGYFPDQKGGADGFVLILNQQANTRDRLLTMLRAMHDR